MNSVSRRVLSAVAGLAAVMALTFAFAHAQSVAPQATPQTPPAGPPAKKAPEQFKNIQVLKDVDAEQLVPTMQFIANSLGVECEKCHVQEKGADGNPHLVPEKDDKPGKLTARKMMQMTMDINKNSFNNRRQVTCNTCHRGAEQPVGIPEIPEVDTPREQPGPPPAGMPTADQILDKYTQALGGAGAIQKITSRVEKGNVIFGTNKTPIEVFAKAPGKRVSVNHGPNGDSFTAFDGTGGWLRGGNGPARDMSAGDSAISKVNSDFFLLTDAKQMFRQLRMGRPEKIGDKEMYVLLGGNQGQPPVKMYFDQETGLLVRVVQYLETALGRNPVEFDYSDYRVVNGIKVPFHWTVARPLGRFSIQIDEVQQNVPIDDSKFAKPASQ
jgi:photosynthetic reaction center cytochrome c subunit